MENNNNKFEFIQKDEKIYDQKIEGRPIGYFEDVWIRFRKNKVNMIASSILLTLVLCSIFMPSLVNKEYIALNEKLAFLPPRVPILENFGIMDGTVYITDKPVNLDSFDEATGLYLPDGYNPIAIDMDTLTNDIEISTEKSPIVLGGQSVMTLDLDSTSYTIESTNYFTIGAGDTLPIDVYSISNGTLEVQIQPTFGAEYETIAKITSAGVHEVSTGMANEVISKVRLCYTANGGNSVAITSIGDIDGYELSMYSYADGKGNWVRANGEMTIASFRYNRYIAAFDLTHEMAFPSSEYYALLEEWGDNVEIIPNPDNPNGWYFSEGFPIREVVQQNDSITVNGQQYYSYEVYLDYGAYLGYEDLPYYWFGTSAAGRDMFSLIWVGLRTSLYIGVVTTLINVTIGVVYGAISGYYGGTVDLLMQRFAELVGRTPWLVILSIMVVIFGPGIQTLIYTILIDGWIGMQSVTRMQFYRYKGREYVLASRTMGASDGRLIFRHILPNGIGTLITSSVLSIPSVIFLEALISYLGFGVGHGQSLNLFGINFTGVSLGVLLSDSRVYLLQYPYLTIFPAVIISILMISFNMFGNALRDAFNPSLRGT